MLGDEPVALLGLAQGAGEALPVERLVQRRQQVVHLERLDQIGERVAVDRLQRRRQRGVARDEDDLEIGARRPERLQQIDAGDVRQLDVDDRRVTGRSLEPREAVGSPRRAVDRVPLGLQDIANGLAHPDVVVDDQQTRRLLFARAWYAVRPGHQVPPEGASSRASSRSSESRASGLARQASAPATSSPGTMCG